MTNQHHITVTFGRGKNYIALLTGRDDRYGFARKFLKTASVGNKMNAYEDFRTIEKVPAGSVVEIVTSNYKGKETRSYALLADDGSHVEISQADVFDRIAQ